MLLNYRNLSLCSNKSVLKLYKNKNLIAELPLNKIKYRDIAKAYRSLTASEL